MRCQARKRRWGLWLWQMLRAGGIGLLTVPSMAATPPADYRFAPSDVIEVTVSPQRGYDRTLTVQPDGKITYPIVGQIQASGLTISQITERLRSSLSQELVDPIVSVSLREAGRREAGRISLLGAIRSAGGLEIKEGTTLTEALAAAGGPGPRADLRRVMITRADGSVKSVDLSSIEQTGRADRSLILQPGDIVVVPEGALATALVLGAVEKAGSYELQPGARLLDAIGQAGGMSARADMRRIMLARAGTPGARTLDLTPLLERGDTSDPDLNLSLQPGDTVFIPETEQQIYVLGSVSKPGLYALKPTDRVLDALVLAGGAAGGTSRAYLVRRGADHQPVTRALNLKKILQRGDTNENELLRPGDVLYVPEKKARRSTLESFNLIWPLTGLFNLLRN
jgi:polysaccharide biosynthesis/export protein